MPVGSMIIANAKNACAQAMERFRADVLAHVGLIETGLSLGAEPATTVAPYMQTAVYASLLPRLDMLKSLGLVWIPGVMAGMLVSGASPVYAGILQFIIVAMILSASGIAGLVATVLMRAGLLEGRAIGPPSGYFRSLGCAEWGSLVVPRRMRRRDRGLDIRAARRSNVQSREGTHR